MRIYTRNVIALILCSFYLALSSAISSSTSASEKISKITVFIAKKIITMEHSIPEATAVAIANGKIVSVGSLESLKPWLDRFEHEIDKTFEDKIIMPGFIDPHVHPSLPAILTQFPFIAPDDWSLPTGEFPGAKTKKAYLQRLKELVDKHQFERENGVKVPFVTWGYHQLWHGRIGRQILDEMFPDKPVILWHRSFHELILNSAALKLGG